MKEWVPFAEGEYVVECAFLVAADGSAVTIGDAFIEVFSDRLGKRQVRGSGNIRNILLVELLDDNDEIDLVLDLGREFKYLLKNPVLKGGKVFSPDVTSALQFAPRTAWRQMSEDDFETLSSGARFLSV
jgi:hypothetical protein